MKPPKQAKQKRKENRDIWGSIPGFPRSETCSIPTHFWDNRMSSNRLSGYHWQLLQFHITLHAELF